MITLRSPICFLRCFNGIGDKMCRCPVLFAATDIYKKIFKDFFPFDGMIYFRVKLNSVNRMACAVCFKSGKRNIFCCCQNLKVRRHSEGLYHCGSSKPAKGPLCLSEDTSSLRFAHQCPAIFAFIAFFYFSAKLFSGKLCTVTNTQYR